MGKTSSPYRRISTTNITRTGSFTKTTPKEKSGRENKMHQISEQSFYSPKEKFCRRKMDYGSVKTKCIYKMPQIQNVNDARSKTPITEKLLVHIPGPQRRILAYPSVPSEKTISRFPIPKAKLAVSSYAFRPQHCTQNFHESDSSYSQSDGKRRYMVLTIPRRPSNSSTDKRKMSTPSRNGNKNIGRFWVDNQPRKIPSTTSSKLRVVRTPSRSQVTHSESYSNQHGRTTEKTEIGNNIQILLKKKNYETTRSCQLDWSDQSNHSYDDVTNKSNTKKVQKTKVGCKNNTSQRHETKSHQVDKYTKNSTITGKSYTHNYNTNRCITKRLGIPNQPENLPRRVRSVYGNMVDKHSRTTDNLVCITHDTNKRSSDTGTMRQLNSCISSQKEYFHNIPSSNDHRTHLEKSSHDGLVTNSITHTRQIQRNCRPIEQKRSTINRMVVTNKSIQKNLKKVPKTSGGSICDSPEQPIENVCFPMSRSGSNSSGCHDNIMEQMGSLISLSPNNNDPKGFGQTDGIQNQECNSNNTRNANQTMVHGTEIATDTINTIESTTTTNSSGQIGESPHINKSSRLAVIKAAYNRQYPNCPKAIALMATPIRKVSVNEYQRNWKTFILFLERKEIQFEKITLANVIQFLSFLFYEKHLKAGTVARYRTALVIPLQAYFNMDIKVPAVNDLLRAMSLQRPRTPTLTPAWSLNKVLSFLESLTQPLSLIMLFRKTAFLLMLATGWRVSELHACVRDQDFCFFTRNSTLCIRPHPSFLGKNEKTQDRWEHKEIRKLHLQDGSISKICPVTSLEEYLKRTSKFKKGKLFLTPNNHQKELTIHTLSKNICQIILMADPETKTKVHDVRKYASSCSFANTMLVGNLVEAMNWSSPATFFKFYFTQTEPLNRPVALPGLNQ